MPSKSKAQHRLMAMAAAGKSSKVPRSVGREFIAADKGRVKLLPARKKGK